MKIRIVSGTELTRPAKNAAAEEEMKSPQAREASRLVDGFMAAEIAAASSTAMCSEAEWTSARQALLGITAKEMAAGLRKRSEELAKEPRSPTQELPTMTIVHADAKSVRGLQDTAYATAVLALDRRTLRAVFTLTRAGADNAGPMGKVFRGTTGACGPTSARRAGRKGCGSVPADRGHDALMRIAPEKGIPRVARGGHCSGSSGPPLAHW
jgi:hypothetical protein